MAYKVADPIPMFVSPGPKPNGLQAADDGLWYIDQGNNNVYKLDWQTGETLFEAPTETVHSSGITLDDEGNVWIASTYSCDIFVVDRETGATIDKFPSPGAGINATREHFDDSMGRAAQPTGDHGLEWKDGHIYIASPPSQFVHVLDASSWKEVHRFKAPGYRVHGIAWAEEEGHMWVSDTSFGIVCRQRIEDGRCYDVFRVPHPVQIHGMTIKDNRLWYADDRGPIGWLSVSMDPDF